MFNNYHELFDGYLAFYRKILSGTEEDSTTTTVLLSSALDNSSLAYLYQLTAPSKASLSGASQASRSSSNHGQSDRSVRLVLGSQQLDQNGQLISIGSFNRLELTDFLYILLIALQLGLAKRLLSYRLRHSAWLAKLGLRPKDRERLDECTWRFVYYSFSSAWLTYTCFLKHQTHLFFDPSVEFNEYPISLDWDEYWICLIECAFYLHATYALLVEDVWRRDSPMMLLHHLAAIFSLLTIYATRVHRVGLTSVVLRDTCDVLLELTKLAMSFRIQHGQVVSSTELPIKCCFSVFALAFTVNQLYYYPLFCIYHGLNITKVYNIHTAAIVGVLTCGLIFLLLDCVWFILILRLLYRMLFTSGSVDDLRDYDADEVLEIQRAKQRRKSTRLLE